MKQCILTIGISASGKTTWATEHAKNLNAAGETWINLNRDDFRDEVFQLKTNKHRFTWGEWQFKWEKEATKKWKEAIANIIASDKVHGVIISDTNLNPKTRNWLTKTFVDAGFYVRETHFAISFEDAVKRDLARHNPVGSAVIAEQIQKYWNQFGERYFPDPKLPEAVIVDIDGTIAHITDRDIFDWTKVMSDAPDPLVVPVVKGLKNQGYKIVILSGRDGECREETEKWLEKHLGFKPDDFFIRGTRDGRKDAIVKREILFRDVAPKYQVVGAIDDRPCVVRLWLSLGIKTLACGFQHREF
jgi:predicted kinase